MTEYSTEQETFWAGDFGNDYIGRNRSDLAVASSTAIFSKMLARTNKVGSVIEFGANIGINIRSIRHLLPHAELSAIEINASAAAELEKIGAVDVRHQSILSFEPEKQWDLAFTSVVLIHIAPEELNSVYDRLYRASSRYILINEYYNPTPVEVTYRGHRSKLFKRDFAGDMLDRFTDLELVDYGFSYHRDHNFSQDDKTWFLLEKR